MSDSSGYGSGSSAESAGESAAKDDSNYGFFEEIDAADDGALSPLPAALVASTGGVPSPSSREALYEEQQVPPPLPFAPSPPFSGTITATAVLPVPPPPPPLTTAPRFPDRRRRTPGGTSRHRSAAPILTRITYIGSSEKSPPRTTGAPTATASRPCTPRTTPRVFSRGASWTATGRPPWGWAVSGW